MMQHDMLDQLNRMAAARGMVMKPGNCSAHGAFEAFALPGDGPSCPVCADAKSREEARAKWVETRVEAIRKHLGVPPRFAKSGLRDWTPVNEAARAVKAMVMQYVRDVRQQPAGWRPLILSGLPGTGKTHLLCALCTNLAEAAVSAHYTTLQTMLAEIKSAYSDNTRSEAGQIARYVRPDFLAIDEIDVMRASDNDRALLFAVINGRYNENKPTAIASNQSPDRLADFVTDRVADRLAESALTLRCDWPSARAAKVAA